MKPGPDPERASYGSFASFADPDGNRHLMQESKTRLPGRVRLGGSGALAALLHETSIPARRLRGGRPGARLVGLVRGVHGRPRARDVAAFPDARTLHDGAQQRLAVVSNLLTVAQRRLERAPVAAIRELATVPTAGMP
jgi:hypothetical protein